MNLNAHLKVSQLEVTFNKWIRRVSALLPGSTLKLAQPSMKPVFFETTRLVKDTQWKRYITHCSPSVFSVPRQLVTRREKLFLRCLLHTHLRSCSPPWRDSPSCLPIGRERRRSKRGPTGVRWCCGGGGERLLVTLNPDLCCAQMGRQPNSIGSRLLFYICL